MSLNIFAALVFPLDQLNFAQVSQATFAETQLLNIGITAADAATFNTQAVNWVIAVAANVQPPITLTAAQAQYLASFLILALINFYKYGAGQL